MKVIKRKKYYYLAHSFRVKDSVRYKERYLGKSIPEDLGQRKVLLLRDALRESAFKKLDRIKNNFRKEWKRHPESIKQKVLVDLSINFTYNTNAIEGSTLTYADTEDLIKRKIAVSKPLQDIQETVNHSRVFLDVLQERKKLTVGLIKRWHHELFSETKPDMAGIWREYLVRVGDYIAPDWQDVPKLMKEFIAWYTRSEKTTHAVELAARAHRKFESIHPFGDGNGRVGRLIIAYILQKKSFPLLVIEYKKRGSYYHALAKSENGFVQYFIRRYLNYFKRYL